MHAVNFVMYGHCNLYNRYILKQIIWRQQWKSGVSQYFIVAL